jgi:arabinofuranan 3-O-arabinosyltransferase
VTSDGLKRPRSACDWGKGGFFTERRLGLCAAGWVIGYAAILAQRVIQHNLPSGLDGKHCADFTWIWLSSKLASSGALARIYDYSLFSAARAGEVGPLASILDHFDYPPTLLFFTYPLGLMPYPIAFAMWMTATLVLYLAAVYAIIPRPAAVIAALTPFPAFINVLLGHNGFLSAGLIGLALAVMKSRPELSGIFLGLLTYKPQLRILIPFALLASLNWRVFLSAAATSVMFAAIAAVAFGYHAWPLFIDALADRASTLSKVPQEVAPFISVFGSLRMLGGSSATSGIAQLAVTAIVAVTICALWARPIPHSLKAAALCSGALLAAPHAISYDACILSIAVAFLVADGLSRGFLPGERGVMLMCWPAVILAMGPVPAIVSLVLLVLVVRRAVLCEGAVATPVPGGIVGVHG